MVYLICKLIRIPERYTRERRGQEIFNEKIELKPYKKYNGKVVKKPITYVHQEDLEQDENAIEVETEEVETNE